MNDTLLRPRPSCLLAATGFAMMALLVGCGPPATIIAGSVTLDGVPVPSASLEFFPVSGKGRVSFTKSDAAGRYRVAVWPTPLKVIVTATKIDGKVQNPFAPQGEMMDRVVNALPEKYGYQEKTPLVADPFEGKTTTIDFSLESTAK
jgi:hypothetical protein